MAIPPALNRDPFVGTGVMDAPDPVVRSAMAKLMNPQGLPPMTQKELDRLLNRQYLEGENIRQAMTTSKQTMAAREAIASGQMAPIDVTSYAGSMFAAPGSYTEARPLPTPTTGFSAERSADRVLKALYGEMLPGQQVRMAGVPDEQMVTGAPQARGIEGTADALLKARFGEMQPGQQVRIAGIPDEMLVPAGQPEVQPVAQPAAQAPSMTGGSAIEQLLGRNLSLFQTPEPIYQQAPAASTVSQVMQMTPFAQQQRLAQQRFAADQREAQRKQMVGTLASMVALGQDITQFNLPPDIMNEAAVEGAKLSQYTKSKVPEIQETVENNIVYRQRFDPNTGQPVGDRIPVRSTAELPGTAKPQSMGQLIPAINPQTGAPIEGIFFDPATREYRNVGIPGSAQTVLGALGLGGVQQPGAQTIPQVKTYEQVLKELQR